MLMKPKYPIYIVSKGRWEKTLTMDTLDRMGVDYFVIVEKQEIEKYKKRVKNDRLLMLPQSFLDDYDTCDDLGESKSKGPGAARNFAMTHSIENNYSKHWVLDDNIDGFHRLNRNLKILCETSAIFRAAEDFVDRYENVPIAGFNYSMFAKRKDTPPPFVLNTRIYSCLLIDNSMPYKWAGRYNEDTHLSLRALKDGFCTIQFNAFLANKVRTQTLEGGNTKEFYAKEGTEPKSKMLADLHPDCSRVVWKFDRVHHFVDYNKFKRNRLIRRKNIEIQQGINEYGMKLIEVNT